jgi:hypothetical protein
MIKPVLAMMTMAFCMTVAACGGSKTIVKNEDSCGKQMTDLQNALNSGAMSQSEYDSARSKALERCNHHD